MKKLISLILAAAFALTLSACNNSTPASDFEYAYDASLGGVVINKYKGTALKVRIPESIEGYPVMVIGWGAFNESGIAYVYIPDSVTSIGSFAFNRCNELTSITIPDSVTTIDNSAFFGYPLGNVTIPDSVTSISSGANNAFLQNEYFTATYKGKTYNAVDYGYGIYRLPDEFYTAVNGG